MASEVDICNLALSRLGDDASVTSINPPEGSMQAEHCARWYPLARDSALEEFSWAFATRRVTLAPLVTGGYALPANTLRVLNAYQVDQQVPFIVQRDQANTVIFAEADSALIVERVTDTTQFTAEFVDAVAWLLASHLAGAIMKGEVGIGMTQQCYQFYTAIVGRQRQKDANEQHIQRDYIPSGIAARA